MEIEVKTGMSDSEMVEQVGAALSFLSRALDAAEDAGIDIQVIGTEGVPVKIDETCELRACRWLP